MDCHFVNKSLIIVNESANLEYNNGFIKNNTGCVLTKLGGDLAFHLIEIIFEIYIN